VIAPALPTNQKFDLWKETFEKWLKKPGEISNGQIPRLEEVRTRAGLESSVFSCQNPICLLVESHLHPCVLIKLPTF